MKIYGFPWSIDPNHPNGTEKNVSVRKNKKRTQKQEQGDTKLVAEGGERRDVKNPIEKGKKDRMGGDEVVIKIVRDENL